MVGRNPPRHCYHPVLQVPVSGSENLYEKSISAADGRIEPAQPKLSAGIIPYRFDSAGELEIYWVKRAKKLRFMGGWHAFPGGRLADSDAAAPLTGELPLSDVYLKSGPPAAHPACGLRELFEETGLLATLGELPACAQLADARDKLLADTMDFDEWLEHNSLRLDQSRLHFAGRWVTPPLSKIRFDATFFLMEWPARESLQPNIIPGELTSGGWVKPPAALAQWESGDVKLAQPTLKTIRILAEHGTEDGLRHFEQFHGREPNAPKCLEFRPAIRVIPLATPTLPPATHTNALLVGDKDLVLIDPGSPWDDQLESLRDIIDVVIHDTGGKLTEIWLTHHHGDHIGGVEWVRNYYNVPVAAHSDSLSKLSERGISVDRVLADGQILELAGPRGLRFRAIHSPGHAKGHLCFYEENQRVLIAGDMVAGSSTIVIDPPEGNMGDFLASLERLAALDIDVLLPSHGTMINEPSRLLDKTRQHRLMREARILEVWQSGTTDPESIVDVVYEELAPEARPIAARQIIAHFEHLKEIGRIERF